jgi:Phytanoyl-CoA dioxygenase (PhyH)
MSLSPYSAFETFRYWNRIKKEMKRDGNRADDAALRNLAPPRGIELDTLVSAMRRDGVVTIPGYWSAEKCVEARAEIDRLIAEYPQCVQNYSVGSDKRMFGVEEVSPVLATFHSDRFAQGIGEVLSGLTFYNFATMGARIDATPVNTGSGDGWHRDGHAFQYKAILYLSEVSDDNGPFEFLPGSHTRWRAAFDIALGDLPPAPNTRYEPSAIEPLIGRFGITRKRFPAAAGTLILANTAGIHRGSPLLEGRRYALTNYYYHPFQVDEGRIEKFSPLMPGAAARVRNDLLPCNRSC